jgi:hypothetical protein
MIEGRFGGRGAGWLASKRLVRVCDTVSRQRSQCLGGREGTFWEKTTWCLSQNFYEILLLSVVRRMRFLLFGWKREKKQAGSKGGGRLLSHGDVWPGSRVMAGVRCALLDGVSA